MSSCWSLECFAGPTGATRLGVEVRSTPIRPNECWFCMTGTSKMPSPFRTICPNEKLDELRQTPQMSTFFANELRPSLWRLLPQLLAEISEGQATNQGVSKLQPLCGVLDKGGNGKTGIPGAVDMLLSLSEGARAWGRTSFGSNEARRRLICRTWVDYFFCKIWGREKQKKINQTLVKCHFTAKDGGILVACAITRISKFQKCLSIAGTSWKVGCHHNRQIEIDSRVKKSIRAKPTHVHEGKRLYDRNYSNARPCITLKSYIFKKCLKSRISERHNSKSSLTLLFYSIWLLLIMQTIFSEKDEFEVFVASKYWS